MPELKSAKTVSGLEPEYPFWLKYALLGTIVLLTFWCYHYSLNNEFTDWDDNVYISENPLVKSLSLQNLTEIFKDTKTGNYHPVTMLSLALNWHYSGSEPRSYYATEIILHLINTILVFFLSFALFKAMLRKGYAEIIGIPYLAGVCALWHGVHPMHVESVSWVAERKDVLYLFFYLVGLLIYVKYAMENKLSLLALVAFFYSLSILSKPMAIVFPFSLFSIDILLKRKIAWNLVFEKIPFFIIAGIFTYLTFIYQTASNNIMPFHITIFQRIIIVSHNYLIYLIKLFAPFHLSAFYSYPGLSDNNYFPLDYYIAPCLAIAVTGGLLYIAYKKGENCFRVTLFGFAFYFFNIMLILQFIPAGDAIMADRYTYASYFGIIFMLVYFLNVLIIKMPLFKTPVILLVILFSGMFAYACEARTHVWHNSETVWEDVISNYQTGQSEKVSPENVQYSSLAHAGIIRAYNNLGLYYLNRNQYEQAVQDFNQAYKFDSTNRKLLENRGYALFIGTKDYASIIEDYSRLIGIDTMDGDYYLKRGIAKLFNGNTLAAVDDFNKGLTINPSDNNCLYYLSRAYLLMKDYPRAIEYALEAQQGGLNLPDGYLMELQRLAITGSE